MTTVSSPSLSTSKNSQEAQHALGEASRNHAPQLEQFWRSAGVHPRPLSVQNMLSQHAKTVC